MIGRPGEQKCGCRVTTHSFQDADGLLTEPDWVEHIIMEDGLEQVILVVSLEGGLPSHHLIHQNPQGPPVHRGAVLQLLQDLFGKQATSEPAKTSTSGHACATNTHGMNCTLSSSLLFHRAEPCVA